MRKTKKQILEFEISVQRAVDTLCLKRFYPSFHTTHTRYSGSGSADIEVGVMNIDSNSILCKSMKAIQQGKKPIQIILAVNTAKIQASQRANIKC